MTVHYRKDVNMPQITLRVSDATFKKLKEAAKIKNLTVTDYLISEVLPEHMDEVVTVNKVLERLKNKKRGDVFSIRDLFSVESWGNFTPGSRISTGRLFYKVYNKNQFNLQKEIKFMGKNSANLAIYEKLV